MADLPSKPAPHDARPHGDSPPRTPRWVYAAALIALVLALLLIVLHLTGNSPGALHKG